MRGATPVPPPIVAEHALFLDFDGTLVELAPTPDTVKVAPELPDLLLAAADRLFGAVAIVSGRPVAELRQYLAPFDGVIAGQHGLETSRGRGRVERRPRAPALTAARPALAAFAAEHDGVLLEDKGATIALHYRSAPALAHPACALADAAVLASHGTLRAIKGKMVVELMPYGLDKGTAIMALLQEPPFRGRVPVFVGDDVTDEDGFDAIGKLGGVAIRVGDGPSAAEFRLAAIADVLEWLGRGLVPHPSSGSR